MYAGMMWKRARALGVFALAGGVLSACGEPSSAPHTSVNAEQAPAGDGSGGGGAPGSLEGGGPVCGGSGGTESNASTCSGGTTSSTGGQGEPPAEKPRPESIRLIALGDTGEGNEAQHLVADQMAAKCVAVGGCTAVLMLGDNFYDFGVQHTRDDQWVSKFEQPYDRPALNDLKFYAVLGNHDYGLTSFGSKEAQVQYTHLPVGSGTGKRLSDKWTMPDPYWDVQFGPVHVFGMDSQDFSEAQQSDMRERVATSTAIWKIVTAHHPRFTSGDHAKDNFLLGNAGMYKAQETIYCGADLFLTGHDHNLEFIRKGRDADCPHTHFAISGAGAKLREKGNEFWRTDTAGEFQEHYSEAVEGFAYLEFDGPTMHFQFIDKFGNMLWQKRFSK